MASTRLTVPLLRRPAGRRRSFVNQRSKTGKLTVGAVNNVRVNLATDTKKLLLRGGGGGGDQSEESGNMVDSFYTRASHRDHLSPGHQWND